MDFTTIISIVIIGFSLAMDAFIVSICDGIAYGKNKKRKLIIVPILFAFFQALMPFLANTPAVTFANSSDFLRVS